MGEATIPKPVKFLFGGSAGMAATCFVQPLDLVKTRMQVSKGVGGAKPSTFSVISSVVKNEGITTLYTGLSAGLLRQATYTTTRLGIYTWLFETFSTGCYQLVLLHAKTNTMSGKRVSRTKRKKETILKGIG